MHLKISVDTSAGRRRLELLTEALTDIQAPLRAFGAYLRARFKERFASEGPGWPPLAQSTGHRLIHTFTGRVTRAGKLRQTDALRRLQHQIARKVVRGKTEIGLAHALLAATRSSGGGALGTALRLAAIGHQHERKLVRLASDYERAAKGKRRKQTRAITKHRHLLGKIGSTIRGQLEGSAVEVGSFIPWAGVHNEGGPVGHDAVVPKRTFAELEEDDVDVLAHTLVERGIAAMKQPS